MEILRLKLSLPNIIYDYDGGHFLNEIEQLNMVKDLSEQNDELKEAYKTLEKEQE